VRIGLYGGSFDPIHRGHLEGARSAGRWLGLDRVVFLPARRPPHKLDRTFASPFDRYALIAASIVGEPWAELSPWELERDGTTFAIEQLESFGRMRPGDRITLLVGADALADFAGWRRAEEIAAGWSIGVFPRDPWSWSSLAAKLPGWLAARFRAFAADAPAPGAISPGEVWGLSIPTVTISSTELRRRLAAGEPTGEDLPPAAAELIRRHRLYREKGTN
jgi:nicotinate-nucleotide adenylyltransferase